MRVIMKLAHNICEFEIALQIYHKTLIPIDPLAHNSAGLLGERQTGFY